MNKKEGEQKSKKTNKTTDNILKHMETKGGRAAVFPRAGRRRRDGGGAGP